MNEIIGKKICIWCNEIEPDENHDLTCSNIFKPKKYNYGWIDIKEKLPLYKECILIFLDNQYIVEAVYRGEYEKGIHVFRIELTHEYITQKRISHWIELPKSPITKGDIC